MGGKNIANPILVTGAAGRVAVVYLTNAATVTRHIL
jgi:hypothetical protein